MSEAHDLHGTPETSHSNLLLSIAGALGTLLLFALIIYIAYYIPATNRAPANEEIVKERKATLAELQAKESDLATTYGVVNPDDGVVRIPVERAMELVVSRLNKSEASE